MRDGLQNEARSASTALKLRLARGLLAAGVRELELGAFVRPDRVPQMADTEQVYRAVRAGKLKLGRARAWALVPNRKGMERALAAGAKNISNSESWAFGRATRITELSRDGHTRLVRSTTTTLASGSIHRLVPAKPR